MKAPLLKQFSLFAAAVTLSLSGLNAATTDPVGYVTKTLASGYNPVGITFTKPAVFNGHVVSSTANSITLSAEPSLNLAENKYYLEVTSDVDGQPSFLGDRIDIASSTGSVITLDFSVMHNTLDTASSLPVGLGLTIRPHFTISDFSDLITDDINSDDTFTASNSDLILLFDGVAFRTHLYFDGNWYENYGSNNLADSKVLAPGYGFFFYRNPSAGIPSSLDIQFSGTVRMNNFVYRLKPGYQFIAQGYPLEADPTDLGFTQSFTASENFVASESDLVLTWDGAFRTHLLYDDGNEKRWYQNFGSNNDVTESPLLSESNAIIVLLRNAEEKLEIVRPF